MQAYLEIVAVNQPKDGTPEVFHAEIIRETAKTFVTKASFTFGITGGTVAQVRKKEVHWYKENGLRQGEPYCPFSPSFHAKKAVMADALPPGAITI
jgi:hypothetical protein